MSAWLRYWRGPMTSCTSLAVLVVLGMLLYRLYDPVNADTVLTQFLITVTVVVGFQVFVGTTGIVSFGHVGFMAIGAYVTAVLAVPVAIKAAALVDGATFAREVSASLPVALAAGVALTALVGFVVGIAIVRLDGAPAAIATYGLLAIVGNLLSNSGSLTNAPGTFYGVPTIGSIWWYFAATVGAILVALVFRYSRTGVALHAARSDELAARTSGVSIFRAKLAAWTLSVAIVALGGGLYATFIQALSPALFGLSATILYLTMVILGGPTISGAVVGAAGLTIVTRALDGISGSMRLGGLTVEVAQITTIVLALIIVLVIMFMPRGLLGRWELHEWWARRGLRRRRASRSRPDPFSGDSAGSPRGQPVS